MDAIIQINDRDMYVIIEPGVSYARLQDALEEKGLRVMVPFGVPPGRSVLTSYLERDVMMAAAHLELGNYLTHDTEMVLPDGELFRTGCWNLGGRPGGLYGPGLNTLYRLWTGSQGTLGIVTKMVISAQHLSSVRKFFFIPFDTLLEIPGALKHIQRREIGLECFALNRFNLAALLNEDWLVPGTFPVSASPSERFRTLRQLLPEWTVVIGLSGFTHFPEEWVQIQEETLRTLCKKLGLHPVSGLPSCPEIENVFLRESLRPWGVLKKFNYRGSVHDLSFKAPLKKLPELAAAVSAAAAAAGYDAQDIGAYFTIIERGRAVHCELDLHCSADNGDRDRVYSLWQAASSLLQDKGALFDRPYGDWAGIVYRKAPGYFSKLRQLKNEMDPQGILNPGKLGF
jgi:FAD/FMN-containing dehydrogenase